MNPRLTITICRASSATGKGLSFSRVVIKLSLENNAIVIYWTTLGWLVARNLLLMTICLLCSRTGYPATVISDSGMLESPYRAYRLPMVPFYSRSARVAGMMLKVSINNGRPLRLLFDTGAKNVVLRARAAEKLGLEFLGASFIGGLGGSGPLVEAKTALARSLEIEDLRMRNCDVEVAEQFPTPDVDGVIGARLFERFLIRFHARERVLELLPLPEENLSAAWTSFIRVRQVGHLLLVKAAVNQSSSGYFLLDTGASFSSVSYDIVPPTRGPGSSIAVTGVNGQIAGASRISPIQFQFSREPVVDYEVIALDMRRTSAQAGFPISGIIGYPLLSRRTLTLNYRDGLIGIADRQ
jgi:Aspartyl protease